MEPFQKIAKCTCPWLANAASDPEVPIVFNEALNEYNLEAGRSIYAIYFCPFCGGSAPDSMRDMTFAVISPEEEERLRALEEQITSWEDAERLLGPPDQQRHILSYREVSKSAEITAQIVDGEWGGIHHMRKHLGRKPAGEEAKKEA